MRTKIDTCSQARSKNFKVRLWQIIEITLNSVIKTVEDAAAELAEGDPKEEVEEVAERNLGNQMGISARI
jgi:hypothetical protein